MLKNYLKIAIRNIIKNKVYSFINIAGLAIGIAGSLLILVYVANQLSYESMHKNRAHIYRVSVVFGSGESTIKLAGAFPALGPAAVAEIPEVKAAVRFRHPEAAVIKIGDKEFKEKNFFFADSNVLNVFTFPLIKGNKNTALNNPSSIVISEDIAKKYFGNSDPVGKRLTYNNKYDFVVSGVMKNVSSNTMLRCELIAPYSRDMEIEKTQMPWMQWGEDFTYLYLKDNASIENIKKKLHELYLKNTNEVMASMMKFVIIPLKDIYFESDLMGELAPTGNITSVYLFSSIAILVLLIACLNFINLSTAKSLRRSKEVGLRKVLGANRGKLIRQFFGESFIITLIALLLSLIIYELVNPLLYNYFDIQLSGNSLLNFNFIIVLISIIIFVSMVAGIYPAVFLSAYKPVDSLKSAKLPGSSGASLRRILVTIQFAITVFLIIGTAAIYKQLSFMRNSNLGFNKKNVIVVNFPVSDKNAAGKYFVVKHAFQSIPGVIDVSGAYTLPGINNKETQSVQLPGKSDKDFSMFQAVGVDYDFIPTLGLQLIKGRNFSENFGLDSTSSIILNETAVKNLGLKNPLGTDVYLPGGNNSQRKATIIGVIKDFHVASFYKKIEPMFLYINPQRYFNIALKINSKDESKILSSLRNDWEKILPGKEFDYSFLEQTYDNLYQSDEKTGSLFSIFSFLSILIACMGLFGLVSYTIEVRTKEMGIRKVLGADFKSITVLLSKDFIRWTLIANIFAWPLAYYAISKWLDGFAYKTSIGISIFIISAVIVVMIALITVSIQAVKAATANPVKSLRYE